MNVKTIEGMQSFEECKKSIRHIGNLIAEGSDCYITNALRADSMKALVSLFERYNQEIIRLDQP